jgi:hypothetical protein
MEEYYSAPLKELIKEQELADGRAHRAKEKKKELWWLK